MPLHYQATTTHDGTLAIALPAPAVDALAAPEAHSGEGADSAILIRDGSIPWSLSATAWNAEPCSETVLSLRAYAFLGRVRRFSGFR